MRKARPWSQLSHHVNMFSGLLQASSTWFLSLPIHSHADHGSNNMQWIWLGTLSRTHTHPFFSSDWWTLVFQAIKKSLSSFAAKVLGTITPKGSEKTWCLGWLCANTPKVSLIETVSRLTQGLDYNSIVSLPLGLWTRALGRRCWSTHPHRK